jgi:anaphase-promoting complex subunit 10
MDSPGDDDDEAVGDDEEEEEEVDGEEDVISGPDPEDGSDDTHTDRTVIKAVPNLDSLYGLRELGREALCWQLSSAKPGNGVEQIRDGLVETYWQSDGSAQPHYVQLHFGRRVAISHVCLYLDFQLDESYTPRRAIVEVGMTMQDLIPACLPVELNEPNGWCIIPLQAPPDPLDVRDHMRNPEPTTTGAVIDSQRPPVKTHLIRISFVAMHQNGRDTHVRLVQLYGPRMHSNTTTAATSSQHHGLGWEASDKQASKSDSARRKTTVDERGMFQSFACIR